jgi:hypothetical protein
MLSAGMYHHVALVRTEVSEEHRLRLQGEYNQRAKNMLAASYS